MSDGTGGVATLRVRYARNGDRYRIWLEERFGSEPHSWAVRDSVTTPPIGAKDVIAAGYDCSRAGIADRGIVAIVPSDQREGLANVAWLIARNTLRFQSVDGRTVSCRERCDDDCVDTEREN